MLSKIIAGVLAAAVLTVGGYAYWNCSCGTNDTPQESVTPCSHSTATVPPCCQEPSRIKVSAEGCCCGEGDEGIPEVLAIAPREVK